MRWKIFGVGSKLRAILQLGQSSCRQQGHSAAVFLALPIIDAGILLQVDDPFLPNFF